MAKWTAILVVAALIITCAAAVADEGTKKTPIALSYQVYYPSSSTTRTAFGNAWSGFGLDILRPQDSKKWDSLVSFHGMSSSRNGGDAVVLAADYGMQKGFSTKKAVEPFAILQAGPYYGRVRTLGTDTNWGVNANATVGVLFNQRFQIEARYDVYSGKVGGLNFNGLTLSAGIKLFDLK